MLPSSMIDLVVDPTQTLHTVTYTRVTDDKGGGDIALITQDHHDMTQHNVKCYGTK